MGASEPVPRIQSPTVEDFDAGYLACDQPVIITGGMRGWQAPQLWTNDYLRQKIGQVVVPVGIHNGRFTDDQAAIRWMTFSEMLDAAAAAGDTGPRHYLFLRSMPDKLRNLMADLAIPDYVDRKRFFECNMFVASSRNLTSLHYDEADNLLALVNGKKRITLFPPRAPVYPCRFENFSQVDIKNPDLKQFPRFSKARARELTLEPGEMLFIPAMWWHQVDSDPGVAVNFWFKPNFRKLVNIKKLFTRQAAVFFLKRFGLLKRKSAYPVPPAAPAGSPAR